MPVTLSAKRKLRADARKQKVNQKVKAGLKLAIKNFKTKPSEESLKAAYSTLDKAAKKGVIPKKRAGRKKSSLAISFSKRPAQNQRKSKISSKARTKKG